MSFALRADGGGGDAYASKDLSAFTGSVWTCESVIYIPPATLTALAGAADVYSGVIITCAPALNDGIFAQNVPGWEWASIAGGGPATAITDFFHTVRFTMTFNSGTSWDVVWKVDGVTVFSYTKNFFFDNTAPDFQLNAGWTFAAGVVGELVYVMSTVVTADAVTVFSDNFGSGDLSMWDTTTGAVSVVTAPTAPAAPAMATPGLVSIAFASTTFDDTPAWDTVYAKTQSWEITRGRQTERDRVETGVATVTLVDATGLLDVLNTLSALAGELEPLKQIRLQEVDPVTSATVTQFTGLIEDWDYTEDQAAAQLTIVLSCVDAFDVFANTEVVPDSTGQASYARQQVDDAQRARLADAGWPSASTQIATGNVYTKPVIYQAGTDILTTLHDCAEAEFPGVAIQFMSRLGLYTFHGRKIRFDPASYPTFVSVWNCGDSVSQAGNDDWAKIHDIGWRNAKNKIVNACLATPEGIAAADVPGQLVIDSTSITARGIRSLKFEGLLTDGNVNSGSTDLAECLLFAQYYVDNWKAPLPQISKLVFKGGDPSDPTNAGTWALICGVELGDLINVVTVNPGGGGFNAGFFVEQIHQIRTAGGERTLELDVSPQALYTTNPFAGTDT